MTRPKHAVAGALICLIAGAQARSQERPLEEASQRATVFLDQGRYKEAEAVLSAALRKAERLSPDDPDLPKTLNNLASVYQGLGRITEAERFYQRSIARYGEISGADSPKLIKPLQNLMSLYLEQGQYGKVERLQRRLLALRTEASVSDPADLIRTLQLQAMTSQARRRYPEAERLYRQALSIGENTPTDEARRATASVLNELSVLYMETRRPDEALEPIQQALGICETLSGENHPILVKPLGNLAAAYIMLHRPMEAEPLLGRALAIQETGFGAQGETYGALLAHYAIVLRLMNRRSEAKKCERRAKEILASAAARTGAGQTVDINDLVRRPAGR